MGEVPSRLHWKSGWRGLYIGNPKKGLCNKWTVPNHIVFIIVSNTHLPDWLRVTPSPWTPWVWATPGARGHSQDTPELPVWPHKSLSSQVRQTLCLNFGKSIRRKERKFSNIVLFSGSSQELGDNGEDDLWTTWGDILKHWDLGGKRKTGTVKVWLHFPLNI